MIISGSETDISTTVLVLFRHLAGCFTMVIMIVHSWYTIVMAWLTYCYHALSLVLQGKAFVCPMKRKLDSQRPIEGDMAYTSLYMSRVSVRDWDGLAYAMGSFLSHSAILFYGPNPGCFNMQKVETG